MATYRISYTDGETETVEAHTLEPSGSHYVGRVGDGSASAYIPAVNVRSIVRQDDQAEDEAAAPRFHERATQAEEKLKAFMDKRYRIESERKAALLDALGMDQTRDWDDILNAARGLRGQLDAVRERDANTP